jgi:hypothetical protein
MGVAKNSGIFHFLEAIEVKLADEAGQFVVPEEERQDLSFELFFIENINLPFCLVQFDDFFVLLVLSESYCTQRILLNFTMKLLALPSLFMPNVIIISIEILKKEFPFRHTYPSNTSPFSPFLWPPLPAVSGAGPQGHKIAYLDHFFNFTNRLSILFSTSTLVFSTPRSLNPHCFSH